MGFLGSVLLAWSAFQEDPAKAAAILDSMSRGYEKLPLISFELEAWNQGNKQLSRKSKVTLKHPNLARIESRVGDEEWLEVFDGKTRWIYEKRFHEYRRREDSKVGEDRFEIGPLLALFLGQGSTVHEWNAHGRLQPWGLEKRKLGDQECDVIVWKEDRNPKKPGNFLTEWRLWVDADRGPRRHEVLTEINGSLFVTTLNYGKIDRVDGEKENLFVFTPPPDALERKPGELLPVGAIARDFKLVHLATFQDYGLADSKGKILLLHVWSDEFENRSDLLKIQSLQDDYAARGVATASVDKNCCLSFGHPLGQYYREQKLSFPLLREPLFTHPGLVEEYGISKYPSYFIIAGGKVAANGVGLDVKRIREQLDALAPKK